MEDLTNSELILLIKKIDEEENYGGLVPITKVFEKVKSDISLDTLHKKLLLMESVNEIYFEAINDPSRLSNDEISSAIIDKVRGTLYYIGRW